MKIIFKYIRKIILRLFFSDPNLLSTITFIPFLYICGWILAFPTLLIGLEKESLSLIGTIFTFLIFVFSLQKWFQTRWNLKNTWTLLGINQIDNNKKLILYFLRGFTLSSILVSLILITIIGTKWGYWIGKIYPDIFLNGIILMVGVGFAEELIFRGWLLEELKNQFGLKNATIAQA